MTKSSGAAKEGSGETEMPKPIEAKIWDRRTISNIRRELSKSFDAFKAASEIASSTDDPVKHAEATKAGNRFYDLYEQRMEDYENSKIEDCTQAETAGDQLVTDFQTYKSVIERHYTAGRAFYKEGAGVEFSGDVDGQKAPSPVKDTEANVTVDVKVLPKSKASNPAVAKVIEIDITNDNSILNKSFSEKGIAPTLNPRQLDTTAQRRPLPPGFQDMVDAQIRNFGIPPTATEQEAALQQIRDQVESSQAAAAASTSAAAAAETDAAAVEAHSKKDTNPHPTPSKPPSERALTGRTPVRDTNPHPAPSEAPSGRASTARTPVGDPPKSKTKSKASQQRAIQVQREMEEDLQREDKRLEDNRSYVEAEMESLKSKMKDLENIMKVDEQLHRQRQEDIVKSAQKQQRIIDAAEKESQADDDDDDRKSGATNLMGDEMDGLEMTVAGLGLGGAEASEETRKWVESGGRAASTAKKEPPKMKRYIPPKRELKDVMPKKKIDFNESTAKAKQGKKWEPPNRAMRSIRKKEPKNKTAETERLEEEKESLHDQEADLAEALRETRAKMAAIDAAISRREASAEYANKETEVESAESTAVTEILKMQTRQMAIAQLKEARPEKKFGGVGKKVDFAKHLLEFKDAIEIPGVSTRQQLSEFRHWFEGSAYKLIEADVMRKNAETAVDDAIAKLSKKFGTQQETALEMLDEALQGKQIAAKDHNGLLDFYTKLSSIHALACETERGNDFENKTIIKTIVEKKLLFLREKWTKKVVKYRIANKSEMDFVQFLEFVDEEHTIADMTSRYSDNQQNKQTPGAKIAATNAASAAKAGGPTAPKVAPGSCLRCGATEHKLPDCGVYRELTSTDRRKFCMNLRLCFRCLEVGHMATKCEATNVCEICQMPHHTLTHPTPAGGNKTPGDAAKGAATEEKKA